jgi:branched-chain amino acid transport system substrate-binding protein
MAKALEGMKLPPEVGLMPELPFYRAGDHQLIGTLYDGTAQAGGSEPDDLFKVTQLVKGVEAAGPVEDSGCKLTWPT